MHPLVKVSWRSCRSVLHFPKAPARSARKSHGKGPAEIFPTPCGSVRPSNANVRHVEGCEPVEPYEGSRDKNSLHEIPRQEVQRSFRVATDSIQEGALPGQS